MVRSLTCQEHSSNVENMFSLPINVAWTRLLVCLASVVYVQGQRLPSSFFGVPGTDAAYDYVIVGGVSTFEYISPFPIGQPGTRVRSKILSTEPPMGHADIPTIMSCYYD